MTLSEGNEASPRSAGFPYKTAALLSAVLPGLGQLLENQLRHSIAIFATGLLLLAATWSLIKTVGTGASIMFLLLLVLPWWALQSYDAYLPSTVETAGLLRTLKIAYERGHDLRYLGAHFFLTAFMDIYIIVANPEYGLKILGTTFEGTWGILWKLQSPVFHLLIGIGFLRVKRWGLLVYLLYAAFGLVNATVNLAVLPPPHRIRITFLVLLAVFTAYILWRRKRFAP